MRPGRVLRVLLWSAAVVLAGALAAAALTLQSQPAVARPPEVAVADVARALRLLRALDPRWQAGGVQREAVLSGRDAELLLDQLARRTVPAATRVTLAPRRARLLLSVPLHGAWSGRWLNVDATLRETPELPRIERLRVGALPLPGWLAEAVLPRLVARHVGADELQLARDVVQGLAFDDDKLVVRYRWVAGTTGRLLAALVPPAEQQRLRAYVEQLATLKPKSIAGGRIALSQLLPPLFALAAQRSADGGDAAQENRAALIALAFAPFPREFVTVVPAALRWRLPPRWRLTLHGRDDFPLHFAISAALAVEGGGPLANAIGVFKEVLDAGDGSGFSFNDIAADRAGTRFGLLALRDPQRLQRALAAGVSDFELLPDVADLPEFMRADEFRQRYGGVGAPAYERQLADIDARLDALPLYRGVR